MPEKSASSITTSTVSLVKTYPTSISKRLFQYMKQIQKKAYCNSIVCPVCSYFEIFSLQLYMRMSFKIGQGSNVNMFVNEHSSSHLMAIMFSYLSSFKRNFQLKRA